MENKLFVPANKIEIIEECKFDTMKLDGRFNPRGLDNKGFQSPEMEKLRRSIQTQGLDSPLLVREVNNHYYLLAGERRLRSIKWLCDKQIVCYNPLNKKQELASEIYIKHGVEVKVKHCKDELEYLRISIGENVLHEPLTEFDLLVQLQRMELAGLSREQQAETMDKSVAWVSQSHSILNSHPKIVEYMRDGRLPRTAAITFINIPKDRIETVLTSAIEAIYNEAEQKIIEGVIERQQASDQYEEKNTIVSVAQFLNSKPDLRETKKEITETKTRIRRADHKISSAKNQTTITDTSILNAARKVGASGNIRRSRPPKEIREKYEELQKKEQNEKTQHLLQALRWVLSVHEPDSVLE